MTDTDVETAVRAAFRSREHLVDGAGEHLLPAVRVRTRRRRGAVSVAAAGVTTVVVLAGLTVALSAGHGDPTPLPVPAADAPARVAPPGWRLESSVGVEIVVPETWATNDFGCGMTGGPSVVRGQTAVPACLTPEPATKEVAILGALPRTALPRLPSALAAVGGVPATRASGRLADGRYAGWVLVESTGLGVNVRTRSEATTRAILDSVRLVDVDHVGCDTLRPSLLRLSGGSETSFVPPAPESVGICYYAEKLSASDRLLTSARLTGDAARRLAAALNAAAPGGNPDRPADQCADRYPPEPDAILLFRSGPDPVATVAVTFSTCTERGADNGTRRVQVSRSLVEALMTAVKAGFSYGGDLPR